MRAGNRNNTRDCLAGKGWLVVAASLLLCVFAFCSAAYCSEDGLQHVLILNSYHQGYPWTDDVMEGIMSRLEQSDLDLEISIEYMDTKRHYSPELLSGFKDLFKLRYGESPFGVIICSDNNSLDFVIENREQLFKDVPVVFCGINSYSPEILKGIRNVTGIAEDTSMRETLELALHLLPQTKAVAAVAGTSSTSQLHMEEFRSIISTMNPGVEIVEIAGGTFRELGQKLQELDRNSVVFLLGFHRDSEGRFSSVPETMRFIKEHGDLPVFSMWKQYVDNGAVGGIVCNGVEQGKHAAGMAIRILLGEDASKIPVMTESPNVPMFDYPALRRYGIREKTLPDDSIVLNRPFSFYDEYKTILWAIIAAFCLLLGLVVILSMSIASRKRAEAEIRRLNVDLENRVSERTSQLQDANKEMEAFSFSVSHDLRAPLRVIDGFSKVLVEDCGTELSEECKEHLARIRESAQRMGSIIDDLLKLSRVQRSEMSLEQVDLSVLAEQTTAELLYQYPEHRPEMEIEKGLSVEGDKRLLKILLENLLGNSWKFTSKVDNPKIEFGSTWADGKRSYFVRDNGAGFDMKYADKLFTPFQRLHAESDYPGTGVGLATVKRILQRHGGDIRFDSEVGKGATFYFTLGQSGE